MPHPKKILTKIHFALLALLLVNFAVRHYLHLSTFVAFVLKIILAVTGIALFFYSYRPFKKIAVYYGYYLFAPLLMLLTLVIDRILAAIVGYVLLFFLWMPNKKYDNGTIRLYSGSKGFLSMCCAYEVKEARFLVFEKPLGTIRGEWADFKNGSVTVKGDSLFVAYKTVATAKDSVVGYKIMR
jgi:hypothetical protein